MSEETEFEEWARKKIGDIPTNCWVKAAWLDGRASLLKSQSNCLHGTPLNCHCKDCFANSLGTNQRER